MVLPQKGLDFYYDIFEESPLSIIILEETNSRFMLNMAARVLLCSQEMISESVSPDVRKIFQTLFQRLLVSTEKQDIFFETLSVSGHKLVMAEIMGKLIYDPQTDSHRGMFILTSIENPSKDYLVSLGFEQDKLPIEAEIKEDITVLSD
ncbi:MAG: hypothetical protein ACE5GM_03360 [bacterium]